MASGREALGAIGEQLASEGTPISPHVVDPPASYFPGEGEHAAVVEAVREGYLLHYGRPRLLAGHDGDLALLAGDYLYALGMRRLALDGDCGAVLRLADLISGCAELHAEGRGEQAADLWQQAASAMADASQ